MADDAAPAPEPEPEAGAKVKRLPEPDKESHQAAVEALHGQIAEKKARLVRRPHFFACRVGCSSPGLATAQRQFGGLRSGTESQRCAGGAL